MPQRGPLQWVDGEGWIILSGGGDWRRGETDSIDAHVLSLANLDRPMAVLLSNGHREEAEAILEHYQALGGPGGQAFVLSQRKEQVFQEDDFLSLLSEAGILYLGGDDPSFLIHSLRSSPAIHKIVKGFATLQGLIIVGAGGGAAALGTWIPGDALLDSEVTGLNFVHHTVVTPHFTRIEQIEALRTMIQSYTGALGLGVPEGSALALGPHGEVETWGSGEVTAVVHKEEA